MCRGRCLPGSGGDAVQVAQRLVIERHAFGAMLGIFGKLSAGQAMPSWEQVPIRRDRIRQAAALTVQAITLAAAAIGLLLSAIFALLIVVDFGHAGQLITRALAAARTALAAAAPNPPAAAVTPAGLWLAGPDVETDPQVRTAWEDACFPSGHCPPRWTVRRGPDVRFSSMEEGPSMFELQEISGVIRI
jgi:hypothetical protein